MFKTGSMEVLVDLETFWTFGFWFFEFVSDFVLRISDFAFQAARTVPMRAG
jgi:hypothetical protein